MARTYAAQTGLIAVSNGATTTLVQVVAPANHDILVHEFSVSIRGTANTEEKSEILAGITNGGGTLSALTGSHVGKYDRGQQNKQSTCEHTATVEPTYNEQLFFEAIHNQSGIIYRFPRPVVIRGGEGFAVRAKNNHSASRNYVARIIFEE